MHCLFWALTSLAAKSCLFLDCTTFFPLSCHPLGHLPSAIVWVWWAFSPPRYSVNWNIRLTFCSLISMVSLSRETFFPLSHFMNPHQWPHPAACNHDKLQDKRISISNNPFSSHSHNHIFFLASQFLPCAQNHLPSKHLSLPHHHFSLVYLHKIDFLSFSLLSSLKNKKNEGIIF